MVKASTTDDSQGDNGDVLINTGTGGGGGPRITKAVIAAGARAQHSRSFGGAIAALVSWFVLITGTNTVSATGRGAQVAGGATAVNSNSAGAVNTTGAPCRPAFSDQMLVPSALQFVFKTGTDNINGHRGAQIAGGTGSVIANGAPTVNTSGAGAINTTGALAHSRQCLLRQNAHPKGVRLRIRHRQGVRYRLQRQNHQLRRRFQDRRRRGRHCRRSCGRQHQECRRRQHIREEKQ